MRNPYATVPYFRTTIYFSFMLTYISLCACYLFTCARVRFIFQLWQLFKAVILVAHGVSYLHLCLIYIYINIYIYIYKSQKHQMLCQLQLHAQPQAENLVGLPQGE